MRTLRRTRQYYLIVVAFIYSLSIGGLQGVFHQQIPAQNNIAKPKSEIFLTAELENGILMEMGLMMRGVYRAIATGSGAFFYFSGGLNGGYAHLTTIGGFIFNSRFPAYNLAQNFTVSFWYRHKLGYILRINTLLRKDLNLIPLFRFFNYSLT